jgi:hypothetical protein
VKLLILVLLLCTLNRVAISQETAVQSATRTVAVNSYIDFTKSNVVPVVWASYDVNKFSVEGRYNYDWDKNVSLFAGAVLKHSDWKTRLMAGVTADHGTSGLVLSPLVTYDGPEAFLYNNPQVNLGISRMPNYLFHWGEVYYKTRDYFWVGLSDRVYFDRKSTDKAFGPLVSFSHKELFLNFYYWLPTAQTDNRYSILLGFERQLVKSQKSPP